MDDTRMLHFQQDYLGCVGDEANILKKCDARRQVYSDNNFSSLSRWLGRLMSIPMTMTVAMYAISVPDVFVFENTLCCYDEQNKLDRYDEMFVRCCDVCCQCTFALGSAKSTLSCAFLLPSPPSSSSRGRGCKNLYVKKFTEQEEETQEEGRQPEGQEGRIRIKLHYLP